MAVPSLANDHPSVDKAAVSRFGLERRTYHCRTERFLLLATARPLAYPRFPDGELLDRAPFSVEDWPHPTVVESLAAIVELIDPCIRRHH